MNTVSQILHDVHGIAIRPGGKGDCPFCHHTTFSVKGDDSLGKCFHPACGRFLAPRSSNGQYAHSLASVLQTIFDDFHQELLGLDPHGRNAYTYLRDERGIHEQVISETLLGAIPSGYDLQSRFQALLDEAQQAASQRPQRGRPRKQGQTPAERLQLLQEAQEKLRKCLEHHAGWLAFFYTDATHRIVQVRFRQPYAKHFVSFKPYASVAGLFGRELFTPFKHPANQWQNDVLLVVEGELNFLQLQSLLVRYAAATSQSPWYVNACAVGSVSGADVTMLAKVAKHPVMCYDRDTHGAGFALVEGAQTVMSVEAFTTPKPDTDLDDFIRDVGTDAVAAWEAVKALVASRTRYLRVYSGTGEEFLRGKTFIPKRLAEAIMEREHFQYAGALLWGYREGVYAPKGEGLVRTHAQALLGEERRENHLEETLRFIEVATHTDDPTPDPRYINVRNGRLDWMTRTLEPHAPVHFETVQLPVEYDPTAQCPAFDRYLDTTLDADVIPLVEEIMGYCTIPDTRFEKAVMLKGEGENGKSVFLDTLAALLGTDNVSNVALQDLEENRFRVAELYGKLANTFADLDARALHSSSMFKTLVTGDPITGERKFKDPFTFRPYARLLFSANRVPPSHDRTYAFYRRWLIIPFERSFKGRQADKSLRAKLRQELPGIFNRAVRGLHRLFANEAFTEPVAVQEALKAYVRSNDNVRVFVDECVEVDAQQSITKKEFYCVYEKWCDDCGERAISQKALKDALKQALPAIGESRPTAKVPWQWNGIKWNDQEVPQHWKTRLPKGSTP